MTGFVIGLFVGGFFGVVIMALCSAVSKAEEHIEELDES